MAFEATHLRFARDLQNRLDIANQSEYLAGSVYPDSRYVTRIHRDMTHGEDAPHDPFQSSLSDFEKGWATHLLYDRLSSERMQSLRPLPGTIKGFNDVWIHRTAEKLIEDMASFRVLGENRSLLRSVQSTTCPRNEPVERLRDYYELIQQIYHDEQMTIHAYDVMWDAFHIPPDIAARVNAAFEQIGKDVTSVREIESVYGYVLQSLH